MVNLRKNGRTILAGITLLAFCLSCTSCETLRKKFHRQKKKDYSESGEFVPVLEPLEYPAPEYNSVENYKQQYSLVKVWYKDLMTAATGKDEDGRVPYALKQIEARLDDMQQLLDPPHKEDFVLMKGYLSYYKQAMKERQEMRNRGRMQRDLRDFDRKLRRDLRVDVIKKDLKTIEAPH